MFACIGLLCLASCPDRTPPPDIVLITVDTLRPDHLSPYGSSDADTPALAGLAAQGVLFENAVCDVTWTIPSMASVLTGQYPTRHGVRSFRDRLPEQARTLPELLADHGYHTAAFVSSVPLDERFGLAQGFDHYDSETTTPFDEDFGELVDRIDEEQNARLHWMAERLGSRAYRSDDEAADAAIDWLRTRRRSPFFLWVHFFGPHEKPHRLGRNRNPLVKIKALTDRKVYAEDVAFMDRQVGRLIETVLSGPGGDDTAIFFHSDHGQTFDEHGFPGHGFDLYDTSARVPLIVRLPGGARAGERVGALVRNLDIFASVLGLAGVPTPEGVESRDLLREAIGHADALTEAEQHVYLETFRGLEADPVGEAIGGRRGPRFVLRGVRTARWKLVVAEVAPPPSSPGARRDAPLRRVELYDLLADPLEQHDLAQERPEIVARLETLLAGHVAGERRRGAGGAEPDAETRERLRELGYLE